MARHPLEPSGYAGLGRVNDDRACRRLYAGPLYLIASGLVGEPTAPVMGIAGATNKNS
jgi:hypothetical protein